ncbi:MAG: VCBS domain-containing protein, partial [Aeromonas sp.]
IKVTSSDGVTQTDVVITIVGTDDAPTLTTGSGSVTEDVDTDNDGKLETNGTLTATGGDTGDQGFEPGTLTGTFGDLTVDANGNWTYEADNNNSVIQGLKPGESKVESFVVTGSDGVSTTTVTITINGADDVPTLTGDEKTVTEDVVNGAGQLETSGVVTTVGGDAGEQNFVAGTEDGKYGQLTINADGTWKYLADNKQDVIQLLGKDETLIDTIKVTSSDGVTQTDVVITIVGVDDKPTLTPDVGSVTEDVDTDGDGKLETSGTLTITGGDTSDQGFIAGTQTGTFGNLTVDANGNWSYAADNSNPVIQAMKPGESKVESFVVTNSDGITTTTVTITINGADDKPTLTGDKDAVTEDTNVNADGNLETSGVVTSVGGDAGEQGFKPETITDPDHYGKLTIDANGNWTYLVDNNLAVIQALPKGVTMTESFVVTAADGVTQTTVDVVITGVNDIPPIEGKDIGEVRDDSTEGLTTSGKLDVDDVDTGESEFIPQDSVEDLYGEFSIDKDGNWTYELDPTKSAFLEIPENGYVVREIVVTSKDGTASKTITINILNPDDATGQYLTPGDDIYESPKNEIDQVIISENDKPPVDDNVYNISISLDVSGSMMLDLENIKTQLHKAVDGIYAQATDRAAEINLHLSTFGDTLTGTESFNLADPGSLNAIDAFIDKIACGMGAELYEASFKDSIDFFLSHSPEDINQMIFITDGKATIYEQNLDVVQDDFGTIYLDYDTVNHKLITLADLYGTEGFKIGDVVYSPETGAALGTITAGANGEPIYSDYWVEGVNIKDPVNTWPEEYKQYVLDQSLHMNAILKEIASIEGISIDTQFGDGADNVPLYDSDGIVSETITPDYLADLILSKIDIADRGSDTVSGGVGDDIIFGDLVVTAAGETLYGDAALFEYISGLSHTTIASTEDAFTYIYQNPDIFDGSTAKDRADILSGDTGNDIVYGQGGDDTISGGQGKDVLVGGTGDDTLTGGYDADRFVITSTSVESGAKDIITDFNRSEGDIIDLTSMISELKGSDMDSIIQNVSDSIKADVVDNDLVLHITSDSKVTQDLVIKDGVNIFDGFDFNSSDAIVSDLINNHIIKTYI